MSHRPHAIGKPRSDNKVMFAYGSGGSVKSEFCTSLASLVWYEARRPLDEMKLGYLSKSDSIYISQNRQHIALDFFRNRQESWLVMVDSDIEFPPTLLDSLVKLASPGRKILAANVPLGYRPNVAFMAIPGRPPGHYSNLWPLPAEPTAVDAAATAVIIIHRDVIVDIYAKFGPRWFQHWYPDEVDAGDEIAFVGEDIAFCRRAKEVGHQAWVGHVKGLGHFKTQRLSEDELSERERVAERLVRMLAAKIKEVEAGAKTT